MRFGLFLLVSVLFLSSAASALMITEIMYDLPGSDSGNEWIEVYNNESVSVNLSGWKFYEAGVNHGLSLLNGTFVLDDGDYAIIVDDMDGFFAARLKKAAS